MSNSPRVSIIAPVCNVAPYLAECLDSLIRQTLEDIEIICVNDCSEDNCGEILAEYAAKDKRIRVVTYEVNKTAAQARKDGALMACGEYVMFIDGDDMLELNACEELVRMMDRRQVDMIQFNTTVQASGDLPEARLANMRKLLAPHRGGLRGESMVDLCFCDKVFHFQIWNKIYRADVCKKAFCCFPDGRFSKAQDVFAFFLVSFFAKSYYGTQKAFYIYRFGAGVTGHTRLNRKQIDRFADQALVSAGIKTFLEQQNSLEKYRASWESISAQLSNDAMAQLAYHVADEDIPYAFEKMCTAWGPAATLGYLAEKFAKNPQRWAGLLSACSNLQPAPRKTKRIATYYHSLCNGGLQRVLAGLAGLWDSMGYEVVVFTRSEPTPDDYAIPASVKRVTLPALQEGGNAKKRAAALYQAVRDYQIDLFVYQAWVEPALLWDMLAIKAAGALCYIHTHSVFSMPLLSVLMKESFAVMPAVYALADGIAVLSKADEAYWRHFNSRVFTVKNPLTFDCEKIQTNRLDGKTILWTGRISKEKRPMQVVEIFARVLEKVPDAKLCLVGGGTPKLEEQIQKRCDKLHIADRVEMAGFHVDVAPFYQKADVFLCTSQYEGFCLTIAEAQSYGVPVVCYDMPYLTILESGKGSFSVPQEDVQAAADRIVMLLTDDELRCRAGREAKENVIEKCTADFSAQWQEIIDSTEQAKQPVQVDAAETVMLNTILQHVSMGVLPYCTNIETGDFVPMPKRGPFKKLRKKIRTVARLIKQEGIAGIADVLKQKMRSIMKK